MLDKHIFKVYQIDIDDDIRKHLYSITKEQLVYLIDKKMVLEDYDVISDDTDHLFTYTMTNNAMSFADVINNQLKSTPTKIQSLEEIILEEELWAYCVFFNIEEDNERIYTFRKILSGKIAIDEIDNTKKSFKQKIFRTFFNTVSQKLELLNGTTVNLDKQIDCIYYLDTFYIAKKTQFEQIIGLEEEFKTKAVEVKDTIAATDMIIGIEVIKQQIEINPSIHKKLVRILKSENYKDLNAATLKIMINVCKQHSISLKTQGDKLLIEDEKDIDLVLKLLADYYKRGEVFGKTYGTFSGKEIPITT